MKVMKDRLWLLCVVRIEVNFMDLLFTCYKSHRSSKREVKQEEECLQLAKQHFH